MPRPALRAARAARARQVEGHFSLARCYVAGIGGLPKDDAQAVRLYRLAAEQGYPRAQYQLALLHDAGAGGLPASAREADRLLQLSAEASYAPAQNLLANRLLDRPGRRARDERQALRLLRLAAAQGFAPGLHNLGLCYDQGKCGLRPDPTRAQEYYELARERRAQGDT